MIQMSDIVKMNDNRNEIVKRSKRIASQVLSVDMDHIDVKLDTSLQNKTSLVIVTNLRFATIKPRCLFTLDVSFDDDNDVFVEM